MRARGDEHRSEWECHGVDPHMVHVEKGGGKGHRLPEPWDPWDHVNNG